jgi:uncharacterized protein YkwD
MRHFRLPITLLIALGFLAATLSSALAAPQPGNSEPVAGNAVTFTAEPEECAFLGIINAYRKSNGLGTLTISVTLSAAAEHHSLDMAKKNYFSHTLANGSSWSQNIANYGYPSDTSRAENIAAGRGSAEEVFQQWKESAGHNKNMLSPKFTAIGIGRVAGVSGSKYKWYWTNTFGSKVDVAYKCSGASTSANTVKPGTPLTIAGGGRTASSTPSTRAFDGSSKTAWSTSGGRTLSSAYIYFDLGSAKSVGQIQWLFSQNGAADRFQVQISTDKRNWTTLTTRTTAKAGAWQSVKAKGKQVRYVRFYFENPNREQVIGYLAEVKILA